MYSLGSRRPRTDGERRLDILANEWKEDYSEKFDELRKHRVELSFLKYGRAKKNFSTGNVNAIKTMQLCVERYLDTGNTEYLCDAANYCMFEYMFPQHPKAHFRATDSSESAGIVGISEREMDQLKMEDY